MFGFKAFAEAPIAAEKEQAQSQPYVESGYWEYGYAEGDQQVSITNVGAIGVSAIGVHAIGRVSTQTVVAEETVSVDATTSVSFPATTIATALASANIGISEAVDFPATTISITPPLARAQVSASVSVNPQLASKTFTVTVLNDYGNRYYIDGYKQASLSLHEEGIYTFDLSSSTLSGHPFKFSTTSDGTHNSGTEYTTNVTTFGTAGSAGAYVRIEVTSSTPDLYYYCGNHSGMGGSITFGVEPSLSPFIAPITAPLASAGVAVSINVAFPATSIDLAVTDESGGASFDASLVEVTVTHPEPSVNAGSQVSIDATGDVAITAAVATSRGDSAVDFVTLIEATTDIAAEVNVTASPDVDFPPVSIDTPAASINAGATLETDFPATDIDAPLPDASVSVSVSVTASASVSAGVVTVQVDRSITVAFSGPVISPAVVGFSAGASVDVDADVIGGTMDVQVFGVAVTEFPTVPVPIVEVVVPTVSITHTANVSVTHSVTATAPVVAYANDITAFTAFPDIDVTSTEARASLLTITQTKNTAANTTFQVNDNTRPTLPSSYFDAPTYSNGSWTGGIKLGSATGAGYATHSFFTFNRTKDKRIQLDSTHPSTYHVRHAVDWTDSNGVEHKGKVVHITFHPATYTTVQWTNNNASSVRPIVGIVHVLNEDVLIDGDRWTLMEDYTFVAGFNRWSVNGVYPLGTSSYLLEAQFDVDTSPASGTSLTTYSKSIRTAQAIGGNHNVNVRALPMIANIDDDKLDRLTMFLTNTNIQYNASNNGGHPAFMPVHNDGTVGPPVEFRSSYIKESTFQKNHNVTSADLRRYYYTHPYFVQSPSDPNSSSYTKTGHYITDSDKPLPVFVGYRQLSGNWYEWQAVALAWADDDQFTSYTTNNSAWQNSWSGLSTTEQANFDVDVDKTHYLYGQADFQSLVPSTNNLYDEGERIADELRTFQLYRKFDQNVDKDVPFSYRLTGDYLIDALNGIVDTSSTTRHVLSDPSTGYDSSTHDFGQNFDVRYEEDLLANAAYLTTSIDQSISYPLGQLVPRVEAPRVQTETTVSPNVSLPSVSITQPIAKASIVADQDVDFAPVSISTPTAEAVGVAQVDVQGVTITTDINVLVSSDQTVDDLSLPAVNVDAIIADTAVAKAVAFPSVDITPVITSQEDVTEPQADIAVSITPPQVRVELTTTVDFAETSITQIAGQVVFTANGPSVTAVAPTVLVETGVTVDITGPSVTISQGVYRAGISVTADAAFPSTIDITPPEPRLQISNTAVASAVAVSASAPDVFTVIGSIAEVDFSDVTIDSPLATVTRADNIATVAMPTVTTDIEGAGFVFVYNPELPRIVTVETESRVAFVATETRKRVIDEEIRITYIMGDQ